MIRFDYIFLAQANTVCSGPANELCNPVYVKSLSGFVTNIIMGIGVLLGIITIAMIVYSGLQMILSQGDEERVSKAKSSLQWSISGLVVILLAYVMVSAIGEFFQINPAVNANPGQIKSPILSNDIISLSQKVFQGLLSIVGIVSIFFIVVSGFRYLTARGDDEQVSQAKNGLKWSFLGLIVSILAYVIAAAVNQFLKG